MCLEQLRRQIARLEAVRRCTDDTPVSSGCGPLDRVLPERGFRRGTLVEWLAAGRGSGAGTLAMGTAREACCNGGALVVLDQRRRFHPPAAARLGIELEDLIVVHAASEADNAWALDQALRCPGVAVVLAWTEQLDGRTFRRLQLAAEQGGGLGLLIRPEAVRHHPSWADVRLLVEPLPVKQPPVKQPPVKQPPVEQSLPTESWHNPKRRLRICLLRCRGAANGRRIEVEIDDETRTVHLASSLAQTTACPRAAGA